MADAELDIKVEALKELINSKICYLRTILDERQDFNREALKLQAVEYERRLEALNSHQAEVNRILGSTVSSPMCAVQMDRLKIDVEELKVYKANAEGKTAATAVWISIVVALLISIIVTLVGKFL